MSTRFISAAESRDVITYCEVPGAIYSCGIVGCGFLLFCPGDSVAAMREARSNMISHQMRCHGVVVRRLPEGKIEANKDALVSDSVLPITHIG
jgi:hypothetical protein